MADDTEREALARLMSPAAWQGIGRTEDERQRTRERSLEAADRILAAGYISPSRHRAEVEAAWKAGRDAAAERLREISKEVEEENDRYSRERLPAVCAEPDCLDLAAIVAALTPPSGDRND